MAYIPAIKPKVAYCVTPILGVVSDTRLEAPKAFLALRW